MQLAVGVFPADVFARHAVDDKVAADGKGDVAFGFAEADLAADYYDPADYIRNYDEFLELTAGGR